MSELLMTPLVLVLLHLMIMLHFNNYLQIIMPPLQPLFRLMLIPMRLLMTLLLPVVLIFVLIFL